MSRFSLTLLSASLIALAGCGGSASQPVTPGLPADDFPAAATVIGDSIPVAAGLDEGVIGYSLLTIDPANLAATITPPRDLTAQGDLVMLSIRPFFGPDDVTPVRVRRDPSGTTVVTVRFRHPFDAPPDILPPGSAVKRIDLHGFDLNALLVADGATSYFAGPDAVTGNFDLLANADAYRDPGATFDASALGISTANVFPYKLVAANIDTGNPLGNYNPSASGWGSTNVLAPTGYDVFPQGAEVEVDFELNLGLTPVSFPLVTLAKYLQPKATDPTKSNRLPLVDPTQLVYFLPEAAGDIQRISAAVTGDLIANSSAEISSVDVTVLDWDHGATVAAAFPNHANTGEISEASDVASVEIDFPDLQAASPFTGAAPAGTAPLIASQVSVTNVDLYNPAIVDDLNGLIRVTDQQDLDDVTDPSKPIVFGEAATVPLPGEVLSSTRYQVVSITVNPPIGAGTCSIYPPGAWALRAVVGLPYRLDLDSATTPASHIDGIVLYRVDYNNDATFDAGTTVSDGFDLPDFVVDPAWLYVTAGPQTIQLECTSGAPSNAVFTCPLTVTVLAQPVVALDPVPTRGIDLDLGDNTINLTGPTNLRLIAPDTNGQVYFGVRNHFAGITGWYVYRSNDDGQNWPVTNQAIVQSFAAGLGTPGSTGGWSLAVMANGLPCFAVADTGTDLGFLAAISEDGTSVNFGPATNGVEIDATGTWSSPVALPDPGDVTRLYVIGRNTSAATGPNPGNGLSLYLSTNATAANPSFTLMPRADDVAGGSTGNWMADIDASGNVHLAHVQTGAVAVDEVYYRRWTDAAPGTGSWDSASVLLTGTPFTEGDLTELYMRLNQAGEPAVVFNADPDDDGAKVDVFVTKFNTGVGWTTPRQVNNGAGLAPLTNTTFDAHLAIDAAGRLHFLWDDDRNTNGIDEGWASVFSADGYTKLVDDFLVNPFPAAGYDHNNHRLDYSPQGNRLVATALGVGPTWATGRARYRTYSVAP